MAGFSNSGDGDVTGNHGGEDYWIVKLAFIPTISSSQQETFSLLLCGTQTLDTLWLRNTGSGMLRIDSAVFNGSTQNFSIVSPATLPDSIAPGDSLRCIVRFSPTTSGTLTTTLNIFANDTAAGHHPWLVAFTGRKDSIGFAVSGVTKHLEGLVDTIDFGYVPCGTPRDSVFLLTNTSSLPATFLLNRYSTVITDTVPLVAGASQSVPVHVPAFSSPGKYDSWVRIVDTCGHVDTVLLSVTVDRPDIVITGVVDTTICPGDTISENVMVRNRSRVMQHLQLSGSAAQFSVAPNALMLLPGDSTTVYLAFHGSAVDGAFVLNGDARDDCGGSHAIAMTVTVRHEPPIVLALQSDITPTTIGIERKVFVVANRPLSDPSVQFAFTAANEPTALQFDSAVSSIALNAVRGGDSVRLSVVGGPWPAFDTIAVLYYQTLAGATLLPTVALRNVYTMQSCNTVTGAGVATIALLPPGCELTTVTVHPIITAIQSIYPNPATGITTLTYSTVEDGNVTIDVRDALGRTMRRIVDAPHKPGTYSASFDASAFANGVYQITMQEGKRSVAREILLLR